MYPRRRLPPRPELAPQMREALVEAMRARRERMESPEVRAAFLASLIDVLAAVTTERVSRAIAKSYDHLGPFKPE